jgi:arylsulfatase
MILKPLSWAAAGGLAAASLALAPVGAVETTGVSGLPSATTTISGKQLPPLDPKFGGVINERASESRPWWPPRVVPQKGAPNVLLIMIDDTCSATRRRSSRSWTIPAGT